MSVFKSELKMLVTHEIGVRVDDSLDAAKREVAVIEGRHAGFLEGAKAVEALLGFVDKDIEEEKLDLETAKSVKLFVTRGVHILQNLAQQAANLRVAQSGKVQGLEQTVTMLKSLVDAERAKTEALKAAEGAPAPANARDRVEGTRPAMTLKEQRQAEAAAEAKPEAEAEAKPEAEAEPPKRRGGRKPRVNDA